MSNNNNSRSFWDVVKSLFRGRTSESRPQSPRPLYPYLPPADSPEGRKLLLHGMQLVREFRTPTPLPQPRIPTKDEMLATRQPAFILQRAALPIPLDAPGRSYVGGLPRLPRELPWPEKQAHEVLALTFLAQIDLSELPAVESSPLPRSGTLFFFADTRNDPDPGDWSVLYYPGDVTNVPFRELPANSRVYGDGGGPWPWFGESEIWSHTSFRFALQFVPFDSYRDFLPDEPRKLRAGVVRPPARNEEALAELMRPQFDARALGLLAQPSENLWDRFSDGEHWPFAWAAIDYAARAMAQSATELQRRTRASTPEAAAEFERIGSRVLLWVERAKNYQPHTRCDQDTRATFLNDWHELETSLQSTCSRHRSYGPRPVLAHVGLAACYVCASNGAADVIPPVLLDALETLTRLNFGDHQMMGHGAPIQWAAVDHANELMLLQLKGEFGTGWDAYSGCVIQFWIDPDALRRRAFGEVQMTLECD